MDVRQWGTPSSNWLIELLLYWEGRINTTPVMSVFGVTRQTAGKWIKDYQNESGNLLCYDAKDKAHHAQGTMQLCYIRGSIDEYFDWRQLGLFPNRSAQLVDKDSHIIRILPPDRFASPTIIPPLLTAIEQNTAVDCEYLSMTSSNPQGRLIFPHAFVKAANRWHVRAYCALRQQFLDFVLSRFQSVEYDGKAADHSQEQDTYWNTQVELILAPDSRLNAQQKAIIEHDYGMTKGQLIISTRAALVKYTLDDLQIKTKMLDANPQAQQLVCVNYADIKQWLYD